MIEPCLMVADLPHHHWLKYWKDPLVAFEDVEPARLAQAPMVAIAPGSAEYLDTCRRILQWKRDGLLPSTRLVFVTYKGRQIWTPENDALVERWVVHARSEMLQIKSDRLAFIPLCLGTAAPGTDGGYLFLGGRKLREFDVALRAAAETGYPCVAVSDRLPEGDYPGIEMRRERIPKRDYSELLSKCRVVLVPLQKSPISHGHMDVISAIRIGKPVVVTAESSCDDYVEHDRWGVLVQNNTVADWVKGIEMAWQNADRYSAAALEKAPAFSADRYTDHVRDLILSLG